MTLKDSSLLFISEKLIEKEIEHFGIKLSRQFTDQIN